MTYGQSLEATWKNSHPPLDETHDDEALVQDMDTAAAAAGKAGRTLVDTQPVPHDPVHSSTPAEHPRPASLQALH